MLPNLKIHSLSFGIASAIVYNLYTYYQVVITHNPIINFIVAFLLSMSFYKIIFNFFVLLFKKIRIIRKAVLGKEYFNGLWIGYYVVDNKVEYYYEIVEQSVDGLTIIGKSFDENKKFIGEWTIVNPVLNIANSKITYYYEMDVASSNNITIGCSKATIYWDKWGYANKLIGFAFDNYSQNKQPYVTTKVAEKHDFEKWLGSNFWNEVKLLYNNTL